MDGVLNNLQISSEIIKLFLSIILLFSGIRFLFEKFFQTNTNLKFQDFTMGYFRDIKKAYDVGAVGVMIPQVDTPDEVKQAIHDAKYPPVGERGIAPFFAGYLDGVSARDVVDNANDETLLILQMESVEAWEQIDEILAIPDFEVILAGPADLSASLGFPGDDATNPKTANVMVDLAHKVKGTGKALATTMSDVDHAKQWIKEGYTMMNIGSSLQYGTIGLSKIFSDIRKEYGVDWH